MCGRGEVAGTWGRGFNAGEIRRDIFAVVGGGFIFVYSPQDKSSCHVPTMQALYP